MVRYILALVLLLQGCASIPQWSENPADCAYETGKYDEGFGKDVYTGVRKYWSSNLICAENPEVIKLPSYLQLLELPWLLETTSLFEELRSELNVHLQKDLDLILLFRC